jgi:hypothetical protein
MAGELPNPCSGIPFDGSDRPATLDLKDLGVHYTLVGLAANPVVYTAPIAGSAIAALMAPWAKRQVRLALTLAVTSGICALVLFAAPFDFVLWFVD